VGELTFLRQWKEEIQSKIDAESGATLETAVAPPSSAMDRAAELRAQIELAVAEERYEDAAMMRDELRRIESQQTK
jgi:protein-arginine kinase activator protein McsA